MKIVDVEANLSFGKWRQGQRLQVDIHDPRVSGLVQVGYLKIIWKEPRDAGQVDSADDPAGAGDVPADRVDTGAARDTVQETQVNGEGEHQPGAEGGNSTPSRRSSRAKDKQPDHLISAPDGTQG